MGQKIIILSILFLWQCSSMVYAQTTIKGQVSDTAGNALPNVSVLLKKQGSSAIVAFTLSKRNGSFEITTPASDSGLFILEAVSIGYHKSKVNYVGNSVTIILQADIKTFKEVVVKSMLPPIIINNDTMEYRANVYKTPEARKVEDLLRNMPGFTIDPDGKIKHNGQEVDRILIEGDDLAAGNYQLISKNLTSNVVEKVQVIDNYNENEVLKTVSRSGKVAINLKLTQAAKTKVSGSADVATSFFKRNSADVNAIQLRKIKAMALGSYNNTGIATAKASSYQLTGDMGDAIGASDAAGSGLLATGSIGVPPILRSYTYNNSNFSTAMLTAWQDKNGRKYRAGINYTNTGNNNTAAGYNKTIVDAVQTWLQTNQNYFTQHQQGLLASFATKKAIGNRSLTQTDIDVEVGKYIPRYNSTVGGVITDTLMEALQRKSLAASFRQTLTTTLQSNKVFHLTMLYRYAYAEENLQAITNRWQDYFQLSPIYNSNHQAIIFNQHKAYLRSNWSGKKGDLLQYSAGATLSWDGLFTQAITRFNATQKTDSTIQLNPTRQGSHILKALVLGNIKQKINQRQIITFSLQAGLANARLKPLLTADNHLYFIANSSIGWKYSKKYLQEYSADGISLNYHFGRNLPSVNQYYAPALITGGVTLLMPAQTLVPETVHNLSFYYGFGSLLTSSRVGLSVTAATHTNSFVKSYNFSPSLTQVLLLPSPQNNHVTAGVMTERYIKHIKTMVTFSLNHSMHSFNTIVNAALYDNTSYATTIYSRLSTAFKGRINAEAQYTISNSSFTTRKEGFNNQSSLVTHNGYAKLKFNPTSKTYASVLVNNYVFSPGNQFFTLDAYIAYRFKNKYNISLTGHNLTNRRALVQKSISSFAESVSSFVLVPRYLLLKIGFDF